MLDYNCIFVLSLSHLPLDQGGQLHVCRLREPQTALSGTPASNPATSHSALVSGGRGREGGGGGGVEGVGERGREGRERGEGGGRERGREGRERGMEGGREKGEREK